MWTFEINEFAGWHHGLEIWRIADLVVLFPGYSVTVPLIITSLLNPTVFNLILVQSPNGIVILGKPALEYPFSENIIFKSLVFG
jgi:hypothetical protein